MAEVVPDAERLVAEAVIALKAELDHEGDLVAARVRHRRIVALNDLLGRLQARSWRHIEKLEKAQREG